VDLHRVQYGVSYPQTGAKWLILMVGDTGIEPVTSAV